MDQRRSRFARAIAAAGVATTTMVLLSSCSSTSTGSANSITELDAYTDQQGSAAWQKILDTCQTKTGITIKRQQVPNSQMTQKILQGVSSKSLSNLVFMDNPQLQQIASTGALAPLSDFGINADGFYDSIVKAGTYQGKLYGIAPGVNGLALIYNKDLFTKAGVQPPTTWAELKAAAAKLTSGNTYGLSFSGIATEEGVWQFLPFFWSNGGNLSNLNTPQAAQALDFVKGLVADGSTSKSVVNWTQNDVADQFVSGNAAMMINGSWNLNRLDAVKGLNYGVVPLPAPETGGKVSVALGGEVATIPLSSTATQQASGKVLNCILEKDNMLAWDNTHSYVPSNKATAAEFATKYPGMASFVAEVATAQSRSAELGEKYTKVSTALGTALQSAITGQQSSSAALAAAQSQAGS